MEEQKQDQPSPVVDEYKGNKILILNPGSRFPFSFGLGKAKLILQHLDSIKKFVSDFDKKTE